MPHCEREIEITNFLKANGWGDAVRTSVPGDASPRRYERLELKGKKAVLMDAPIGSDGVVCPDGASEQERLDIGYTAMARVAGSDLPAFVCIASALTQRGFSAPHILATGLEQGLLLLEDMGDDLYARVLKDHPEREEALYKNAVSCLAAIYRSTFSIDLEAHGAHWKVNDYDTMALRTEADLFLNWYVPKFGGDVGDTAKQEWHDIWTRAFERLNAHASGLALRDFHAENIFSLESSVGLIDFQDALFAHPSYDLVSLIEDARRDVSPHLAAPLITQFCKEAGIVEDDGFHAAYAVQGAQRNAKILGIFMRLAQRDGKVRYLDFIPRVAVHFQKDLSHPALAELKEWMQSYAPTVLEVKP